MNTRRISSVSTTQRRNTCHITQARGPPRTAPAAQEPREITPSSRYSSPRTWVRVAPRARNTPVSLDFCRKKRPEA